jgi:hypothetical protein
MSRNRTWADAHYLIAPAASGMMMRPWFAAEPMRPLSGTWNVLLAQPDREVLPVSSFPVLDPREGTTMVAGSRLHAIVWTVSQEKICRGHTCVAAMLHGIQVASAPR